MRNIRSVITLLLGWPLSFLALVFVIRIIISQSGSLLTTLTIHNPLLLFFGIFFFFLFYFFRSYLWQQLLHAKGYEVELKESMYYWSFSELNRFIPGNIWSFLGRFHVYTKKGVPKKVIVLSLLTESILFIHGCCIVSLFVIFYIAQTYPSFIPYPQVFPYVILFLVLLGTISTLYSQEVLKKLPITKLPFITYFLTELAPSKNAQLLLLSITANFFFGLGTYATISAIAFLTPVLLFNFIGFFVLSLLIGYLTIITPMGLGVREGIITYGLATQLPLALAGICAIFARIVLIISEILFFMFCVFWHRTTAPIVLKIQNAFQKHLPLFIVLFAMTLYISYFTAASFARHDNFYTGRYDLGNMAQTVWNTSEGRIFQFTNPDGTENVSRLVFHADFILILLAPFQYLWESPKILLLLQTIILSFGSLFIYLIGKHVLKEKKLPVILACIYLINPSINYANLYDFHAVALATTFLLGTFYFLLQKKYIWFVIFALLSAITKEQIWLIVMLFGLSLFFVEKKRKLGAIVAVLSIAVFYFIVWYAIPTIRGSNHFALAYYSDYGGTPTEIIKNILFSPGKIFQTVLQKDQLTYLLELFSPLGFLSFFGPVSLVFAGPDLLLNLLSQNTQLHQIYFQYTATIIPFTYTSAIFGVAFLRKRVPRLTSGIIGIYLILCASYTAYAFGPLPGAQHPNLDMFTKTQPKKEVINRVLSMIPHDLQVAATNNLGAHLSHRQHIYTIPLGMDKADVLAFLLNDSYAQPSLQSQIAMVEKLKNDPAYQVMFEEDDFIVLKKKTVAWDLFY